MQGAIGEEDREGQECQGRAGDNACNGSEDHDPGALQIVRSQLCAEGDIGHVEHRNEAPGCDRENGQPYTETGLVQPLGRREEETDGHGDQGDRHDHQGQPAPQPCFHVVGPGADNGVYDRVEGKTCGQGRADQGAREPKHRGVVEEDQAQGGVEPAALCTLAKGVENLDGEGGLWPLCGAR